MCPTNKSGNLIRLASGSLKLKDPRPNTMLSLSSNINIPKETAVMITTLLDSQDMLIHFLLFSWLWAETTVEKSH